MNRIIELVYAALMAGIMCMPLVSCSSEGPDDSEEVREFTPFTRIPFTEEEQAAIDAAKPFGLDLFRKYCEISGEDNVLISPLSAILDLGMLANGATGETQAEILDVLGWGASGLEDMNAYANRLMSEYRGMDRTADVMIANGIFNKEGYLSVKPDYIEKMRSIYDADWRSYDENKFETEVSKWISEKTDGLIKDMDLGYKNAHLSLLNALYFKGVWKNPFDREKTRKDVFTNSDGTVSEVEYLCKESGVSVYQNEMFTNILLGFGNSAYYIEFLLPDEELSIDACISALDMDMWHSLLLRGQGMRLNLRIPKFGLSMVSDLKESLKELGIRRAFGSAQLDNMLIFDGGGDVAVSSIKQGGSFSVDEEGVTASATTAANMMVGSIDLVDGGDFFLDRPFVFAIRENSSGAILFMGKVGKL